ncbi:unnamed protein product [Euphydryas editha]|uniref:Uncharacterized protein n=1 Tax=Euphydryas editha TaxID=104508 RepID=A0AAU9TDW2_EUPED|nr:unnamed protein product [Euphydryas editha]
MQIVLLYVTVQVTAAPALGNAKENHTVSRPGTSQNYTMEKEHALEEMMGKLGAYDHMLEITVGSFLGEAGLTV